MTDNRIVADKGNTPSFANIPAPRIAIPGVEDMDGDGASDMGEDKLGQGAWWVQYLLFRRFGNDALR